MQVEEIFQCESLDKYLAFFISHTPIYEGATGVKFCLQSHEGKKYFLKPYPPKKDNKIDHQFKLMQEAYETGVPMAKPITLVKFTEGGGAILSPWLDGLSLSSKKMIEVLFVSPAYQYRLGCDCASAIKKLHSIPVENNITIENDISTEKKTSLSSHNRSDRYKKSLDQYRENTTCKHFHYYIDKVMHYIESIDKKVLDRQFSYIISDYSTYNVMLQNDTIMCVDTDTIKPGDPWHDVRHFCGVEIMHKGLDYLYCGLVHQYFDGDPPKEFWQFMRFYQVFRNMRNYSGSFKDTKSSKKLLAKLIDSVNEMQNDAPPPWYISYNDIFKAIIQTSSDSYGFIFHMSRVRILWVLTLLKIFVYGLIKISGRFWTMRRLFR